MSDIKCFRMTTGEIVISEYSENDNQIILETPLLVFPRTENGTTNVWFEPYPFGSADKVIEIEKDKIFFTYNPSKEILQKYMELTDNE